MTCFFDNCYPGLKSKSYKNLFSCIITDCLVQDDIIKYFDDIMKGMGAYCENEEKREICKAAKDLYVTCAEKND